MVTIVTFIDRTLFRFSREYKVNKVKYQQKLIFSLKYDYDDISW